MIEASTKLGVAIAAVLFLTLIILDGNIKSQRQTKNQESDGIFRHEKITQTSSDLSAGELAESPNADWLTYAGDYGAKRHSPLNQVDTKNVFSLVSKWVHNVEETTQLRVTPLVRAGVMYITGPHEVRALDASSGELKWRWRGTNYGEDGFNRGAAILGKRVFIVTADCTLVALDSSTGKLIWQKKYAHAKYGNYCTLAPLALKDKILVGASCGSDSARGFVAALSASDGRELWRFWAVPPKGMSGSETWGKNLAKVGGAATWINGTYDPALNLVFWPTGNPRPGFDGNIRPGDNLYSDSVLALNPDTGELKWYFQFMPHDTHEWDAAEYPVLVDMIWRGKIRKLIFQANRNGFFYVLDRTNGEFLSGRPFVKKMTWAKELDSRGRPIEAPGMDFGDNNEKKEVCPGLVGATNWMSPSYNPSTNLFYVVTLEHCDMESGEYYLRAIDPQSGNIKWEYPMPRRGPMAAGTVSTAGGLVFVGDASGHLVALQADTGKKLWQFAMGRGIFASPMTYSVNDQQYVAIAAGSDIFAFGLFQSK